jgi:hypothetical protein
MSETFETYEQACIRTGRKWPYRNSDWPCPACGKEECDLDIEMTWKGWQRGVLTYVYQHVGAGDGR